MRKLRSRAGTTLTEMLVAVMILGLTTTAVATAITASLPVYQHSVAFSESALLSSTVSQAIMDELRYAQFIRQDGETVRYVSAQYGRDAAITLSADGEVLVNDKRLIGSGSYSNLTISTLSIEYIDGFCDILFSIYQGNTLVNETRFSVRPINAK